MPWRLITFMNCKESVMVEARGERLFAGFKAWCLRSEAVEIAVIPELGARIVSLKNRRTGREWMWHPGESMRLFRNETRDDFSRSTLVGADECIPTIAPCAWQGRDLPDHGEVWSMAWHLDPAAWDRGAIRTAVDLPISPLRFERTITLLGNRVRLHYALTNRGSSDEHYLWAFHPLLRIVEGDLLDVPAATRRVLNGEAWIDAISEIIPAGGCSKLFAYGVGDRRVAVGNRHSGESLEFEWTGSDNNMLGLWLTRGGWHGHHHLAVEPTNGAPDALAEAAERKCCGFIEAGQKKTWEILINVNSYDQNKHRAAAVAEPVAARTCG